MSPMSPKLSRICSGVMLGTFAGMAVEALNLDVLLGSFSHVILLTAIIGGVIALTRFVSALWIANAVLLMGMVVIGYTPLVARLTRVLATRQSLGQADAVIVLAGGDVSDNTIDAHSQDRLLHGLQLMRAGYAPLLILTQPADENAIWPTLARQEISQLGLHLSVEVVGPVRDTHDESLAVVRLLRSHGWNRVILVTHSWHMRRAAALFQKAGVTVFCSPCHDSRCSDRLETADDRLTAFGYWLHEVVGYAVYRRRGWV